MCSDVSAYLSASQVFLYWAGIPMFEFSQDWTVRMLFPDSTKHRWLPSPYTPRCPSPSFGVICCAVRKLFSQFCDIMVLTRALWFFFSLSRLTFSSSYTSSRSSCPNWGRTKWDILTTSSGGCPTVRGLVHPKVKCLASFIPNLFEFLLLQWNTKDVWLKHTVSCQ